MAFLQGRVNNQVARVNIGQVLVPVSAGVVTVRRLARVVARDLGTLLLAELEAFEALVRHRVLEVRYLHALEGI